MTVIVVVDEITSPVEITSDTQVIEVSDNSGSKFIFNGSGGNSYLIYNTTTSKVELYVNGVIKASWG